MKKCAECGMEMKEPPDFCNVDIKSSLCVHCCPKVDDKEIADPSKGNLE